MNKSVSGKSIRPTGIEIADGSRIDRPLGIPFVGKIGKERVTAMHRDWELLILMMVGVLIEVAMVMVGYLFA
ncbi:hypothetical protein [Laceyella putida]|uniref:Uncharacterized protein n=1 Tax=Laceyella putida TaxID=110101 RepID=A0ABW2RFL8_9BACL